MFISEDAKLAVKQGINWLDENHPGWEYQIDLSQLDMAECDKCVIGQSVGNYTETVANTVNSRDPEVYAIWAIQHGFESPTIYLYRYFIDYSDYEPTYSYPELDTLWSEEVRRRLG